MKVQLASDLHLEFSQNKEFLKVNPITPIGDVLVLAGDIVPFSVMHKQDDFFKYVSDHFQTTYWIPGNHEYYYFDITERSGAFTEKIKENVFLVNNTSVVHDDVKLIFSTLWSKILPGNEWQILSSLSDFQVIKENGNLFTIQKFNQLYEDSLAFVKSELTSNKNNKTVVVSHHVPTLFNYPEKYKDSDINNAFAVELYDFIDKNRPDFWVFGHHHVNIDDFEIGKTKLLTNQLGYVKYNENQGYSGQKHIIL